ncbi:MAG TPA: hypothetical protein VG895_01335 [Patescibacteria group bacterium]|nr:hypothetical protein [Patescibacteria group bacterium]
MAKQILFFFIVLFIFTVGLIFFHNSRYETNEFDTICHSQYTEKVWIDACLLPYQSEIRTFELSRNIEIAGIVLTGAFLGTKYLWSGRINPIKLE